MLGSSKYVRSNRFIGMLGAAKYARSNRFYMHARCSEVCTEQPFLYACSVQRSMHRAPGFDMRARCSEVCTEQPVMTCLLGASKYARSNCFI